jgi:hypothetical protein
MLGEMASRMVLATSRLSVLETEMGRSLSVVKDSSLGKKSSEWLKALWGRPAWERCRTRRSSMGPSKSNKLR